MSDERDPRLLELFATREALDGDPFAEKVIRQIEREQRSTARIRITALASVLIILAFAMPTMVRYVAVVSHALALDATRAFVADAGSSWLPRVALSLAGFGVAAIWRTLRNAR